MPAHRLVTLAFSHYNEKARWALDHCGVDYVEQRYLPGFSQLAVMVATRGRGGAADRVSTRWSTPLLVTSNGTALHDSTAIARWADQATPGDTLFPDPGVGELVDQLGAELGPATRLVGYWHAMRSPTALGTMARRNVGAAQAAVFRLAAPILRGGITRALGITTARYDRALQRVRDQLALAERRLATRPYLAGDRFTAADLTFAALLAPALLLTPHEGYGAAFAELDELSAEARALVAEVRASRAGAFALDVYRRHRRARRRS